MEKLYAHNGKEGKMSAHFRFFSLTLSRGCCIISLHFGKEAAMLPEAFCKRMRLLLGDEYADFERSLTEGSAVRGVRINRIKASADAALGEIPLTPLSYTADGFVLHSDEPIGAHPLHHSGAIYMQDPGAMATLSALDIKPHYRIIDLCAAPGGKSTQAAAMLGADGFIISNEYVTARAKLMVGNFERLGVKSSMITSLDTAEFGKHFKSYFDLCIADVPCSGEGMFRKSSDALSMWSEENVALCAKRQRQIIENAAPLVKAGGYLLYSTCTFSLEENEMIIDEFLRAHGEYSLIPVKRELAAVTSPGINFGGALHDLSAARRFYPHKANGEGQFIALMKKRENPEDLPRILYKNTLKPLSREERATLYGFMTDTLTDVDFEVMKHSDKLVISNFAIPPMPYGVLEYGILVGEVRGKSLIPSHQFYSAMGGSFKRKLELSGDAALLSRYLRGEQIPAPPELQGGYTAVCYHGAVIGGGKCIGEVINNHYPKGLRNKN